MSSDSVDVAATIRQRLGRNTFQVQTPHGLQLQTGFRLLDDLSSASAKVKGASVVEIVGSSSAGKTRLLHLLAAKALLLNSRANEKRASSTSTEPKPYVCWYDLNGGFDVEFLSNILSRHLKSNDSNSTPEAETLNLLSHMNVYTVDSVLQLCASLRDLCEHIRTLEGSEITCVIIDALGISHYHDKYRSDARMRGNELSIDITLTQVIRQLFATSNKVLIYCSKCAIFDSDKLNVAEWPFKSAGIPTIPRDFLPDAWKQLVSHVILLYHIDHSTTENEPFCLRGVLCLYYQPVRKGNMQRKPVVGAASVLRISDSVVECVNKNTHMVR